MGGGGMPGGAAVDHQLEEAAVAHQLDCVSEDVALDGRGGGEREHDHEREL